MNTCIAAKEWSSRESLARNALKLGFVAPVTITAPSRIISVDRTGNGIAGHNLPDLATHPV